MFSVVQYSVCAFKGTGGREATRRYGFITGGYLVLTETNAKARETSWFQQVPSSACSGGRSLAILPFFGEVSPVPWSCQERQAVQTYGVWKEAPCRIGYRQSREILLGV